MKTFARLMLAGALAVAFAQSSYAQMSPPAAPAAPAGPAAPKAPAAPKPKVPLSAEDMAKKAKEKECSEKATAQGLHCDRKTHKGCKERWEYREKCKKGEM